MRHGVRLGIDVGKARVGVARSDAEGRLAMPVATLPRVDATPLLDRIVALAAEHDAFEVVVGLPLSLSGRDTQSTQDARDVATALAAAVDVRLVDERLSTVTATQGMRAAGRKAKQQRSVIDQAAAVVILQHALDAERTSGDAPGALVDGGER